MFHWIDFFMQCFARFNLYHYYIIVVVVVFIIIILLTSLLLLLPLLFVGLD